MSAKWNSHGVAPVYTLQGIHVAVETHRNTEIPTPMSNFPRIAMVQRASAGRNELLASEASVLLYALSNDACNEHRLNRSREGSYDSGNYVERLPRAWVGGFTPGFPTRAAKCAE